jgi:YggT family protein
MVLDNLQQRDYLFLTILFTAMFIKGYYWALSIRFIVQWFPNVNPYIHPMFGLIALTDIFLKEFQGLIPTIFGMDLSAMLAFLCLEWMIRTLDSIVIM